MMVFGLQIVLDSDDRRFGGFGRIDAGASFFSAVSTLDNLVLKFLSTGNTPILVSEMLIDFLIRQEGWFDDRPHSFQVYTPSRTAVVYSLVED